MLQVYTPERIVQQMINGVRDEEDAEMFRLLTHHYFVHSNCYLLLSNSEKLFSDDPGPLSFL